MQGQQAQAESGSPSERKGWQCWPGAGWGAGTEYGKVPAQKTGVENLGLAWKENKRSYTSQLRSKGVKCTA